MEIFEKYEQYQNVNRRKAQLEVFNVVSELLSISFEKYDVEVIAESDNYLKNDENTNETNCLMKTEIDHEDISETENMLEVLLSGKVKDTCDYEETFMMYFSLHYEDEVNRPWSPWVNKGNGLNLIRLKVRRKIEQLSDQIFSINWVHEDCCGNTFVLGTGMGILVFSRDNDCSTN
jgi:hypothetical protein